MGFNVDFRNHSKNGLNVRVSSGGPVRRTRKIPCFKEKLVARLRRQIPDDDELERARILFAALADSTRLKILHAFLDGDELCVCDVAHVTGMSVSAASHHLRKLRALQILSFRDHGKWTYYSLRDPFAGKLVERALGRRAA